MYPSFSNNIRHECHDVDKEDQQMSLNDFKRSTFNVKIQLTEALRSLNIRNPPSSLICSRVKSAKLEGNTADYRGSRREIDDGDSSCSILSRCALLNTLYVRGTKDDEIDFFSVLTTDLHATTNCTRPTSTDLTVRSIQYEDLRTNHAKLALFFDLVDLVYPRLENIRVHASVKLAGDEEFREFIGMDYVQSLFDVARELRATGRLRNLTYVIHSRSRNDLGCEESILNVTWNKVPASDLVGVGVSTEHFLQLTELTIHDQMLNSTTDELFGRLDKVETLTYRCPATSPQNYSFTALADLVHPHRRMLSTLESLRNLRELRIKIRKLKILWSLEWARYLARSKIQTLEVECQHLILEPNTTFPKNTVLTELKIKIASGYRKAVNQNFDPTNILSSLLHLKQLTIFILSFRGPVFRLNIADHSLTHLTVLELTNAGCTPKSIQSTYGIDKLKNLEKLKIPLDALVKETNLSLPVLKKLKIWKDTSQPIQLCIVSEWLKTLDAPSIDYLNISGRLETTQSDIDYTYLLSLEFLSALKTLRYLVVDSPIAFLDDDVERNPENERVETAFRKCNELRILETSNFNYQRTNNENTIQLMRSKNTDILSEF